ncbi:hypothetical protein EGW08_010013, partial [Elysia chlorotica]
YNIDLTDVFTCNQKVEIESSATSCFKPFLEREMNRKLDLIGAYNRPRTLGPIMTSVKGEQLGVTSSQKHSDKEFKTLQAENAKLKKQCNELNATLKQLTQETSHEKFDERRVNLLKLQIIQLEKQVCILNEALGGRHEAIMEVENTMAWLADKLRSFIAADIKGPMVPIARSDLMAFVESSESARIKLFKAIEGSAKESVGKDLLFLNPFLGGHYKQGENITLLDISLNRMDYLNLRHVAQLESKLSNIYKDLIRVLEQIEYSAVDPIFVKRRRSGQSDRFKTTVLKTCISLKDVADDLMSLSLLCPSAPWPALKRPLSQDVSLERVKLNIPPGLSRQKQEEINHIIESSIGVCNHRNHLLEKENAVLKEELNFHRATHDLQVQYTKSLFEAVGKGYDEFEKSAREIVVKPIKNMLDAYRELKESASEQALRDFLVIIKENEEQLSSVENMFEKEDLEKEESDLSAFSKFELDFTSKLEALAEKCQKERNKAIKSRKDVAQEQSRKDLELQQMIQDLEFKYEKQWNPVKPFNFSPETQAMLNVEEFNEVQSDLNDANLGIDNSKSSSDRNHRDEPLVLRSYLYSDNARSYNSPEMGACSTPVSFQNNKGKDSTDHPDALSKRAKKLTRKKKWEPEQEWVCDFSGLNDRSATTSTDRSYTHRPQTGLDKKPKDHFTPALSSPNISNNPAASCDEIISNVDTCKTEVNKIKKNPYTYKPNLSVAKHTLNLRRAGSLSGLNPVDLGGDQDESQMKETIRNNPRSDGPEICPQSVKPKQKSATFQKRNSWR